MQSEEWLLAHCRKLIEEKLGWGESKAWMNQDFSRLSEEIAEATDVVLSPTTLQRIWGKVRYQSAPHTTHYNHRGAYPHS